jgi:hypothetical protein
MTSSTVVNVILIQAAIPILDGPMKLFYQKSFITERGNVRDTIYNSYDLWAKSEMHDN